MTEPPFLEAELSLEPNRDAWRNADTKTHFSRSGANGDIRIAKRVDYPATRIITQDDALVFGYAADHVWNRLLSGTTVRQFDPNVYKDEFLLISVERSGTVTIRRDSFCTAPLFFAVDGARLVLSSRFDKVVRTLGDTDQVINTVSLMELLLAVDINELTLFERVRLLGERTTLTASEQGVEVHTPPDRPTYSGTADQRSFEKSLESALDRWFARAYRPGRTAFEASAGIDSATAAGYAARQGLPVIIGSMGFPDTFGESQSNKLSAIRTAFQADVETVPIDPENDYPLARFLLSHTKALPYQYEEIYTEILSRLADRLKDRGITTMFTGIGGDELFESPGGEAVSSTGPEEARRRQDTPIPPFYTSRFADLFKDSVEALAQQARIALPLTARSALFANASRNNVYIERGIWPVAPLADPTLLAHCQTLPPELRQKKTALRRYQSSREYPAEIHQPELNEHFGPFFETSIKKHYGEAIDWLLEESLLVGWGLSDPKGIKSSFRALQHGEIPPHEAFPIFLWVKTELILQSAGGTRLAQS